METGARASQRDSKAWWQRQQLVEDTVSDIVLRFLIVLHDSFNSPLMQRSEDFTTAAALASPSDTERQPSKTIGSFRSPGRSR